jgi:hypothetical protein
MFGESGRQPVFLPSKAANRAAAGAVQAGKGRATTQIGRGSWNSAGGAYSLWDGFVSYDLEIPENDSPT